ncbi:hypothetical protein ETAA8_37250 [Anatilimnocola aggregata]|uniref:DUF1553 domain-containing protein n=1 Tax=Anatilimnocola aggregata TaxID=2528021 RepID=A0A517YEP7_9BACT|nr:DUF1549 domain-containing protein [Anatilimnocola aggregata]QDU28622.1 hypothetical protein ETAA8_37250 [Anatilimnocola aggregata]
MRQRTNSFAMVSFVLTAFACGALQLLAGESDFAKVAQEIDRRLADHWQSKNITPAKQADDATLLKRLTLDLTGRIPTRTEWEVRLQDGKPLVDRWPALVQELMTGPEFPLHYGAVLEEMLQGSAAGNADFTDYLRTSLRSGKRWDAIFRELMIGPWDVAERKPATKFLEIRAKDLDRLTTDTTRVFFGVDVSCARCHDHPLVADWKQDHYYGMASFFNRTSGGKGSISEKTEGDVTFKGSDGSQQTARVMFLSGSLAADPPALDGKKPKVSRREQLVTLALTEQRFFSRSFVNRVWQQVFGRGLIDPVDQMHSANPASVPGLLEWLADDFVNSGYDIQRLIGGLVSSRAYRLSSQWETLSPVPDESDFAVRRVSPLSPRQYAFSVLVATGRASFAEPSALEQRAEKLAGSKGSHRVEQYLAAEQQAAALLPHLDPVQDGLTSAAEALYLSNNVATQKVVAADEGTVTSRLVVEKDNRAIAAAAIRAIYCRAPRSGEIDQLAAWLSQSNAGLPQTCEQLVWALITSAEFRFKH